MLEEKETYVFLDFQGKDVRSLKELSIYFRILNLNKEKPVIEIGDDVYEGSYEDAVGTNVFFEESEDTNQNVNIFEGTTPIALRYLLKQSKILKMKKIGVKSEPMMDSIPSEAVNIKIEDDYNTILSKFQSNELNIENYVEVADDTNAESNLKTDQNILKDTETENMQKDTQSHYEKVSWYPIAKSQSNTTERDGSVNPTYLKYRELKGIINESTKHKRFSDLKETPSCSSGKNDFMAWKELVMRCVDEQPLNWNIRKDHLEDFVDIEKSIEAGIISQSISVPRIFTEDEKRELLSFKNFINLAVFMKLVMLQDLVKLSKECIRDMNEDELRIKDEDGYTMQEKLNLLKEFKNDLENHILSRLQSEDEYVLEDEFKMVLNDEELSESDSNLSDEEQSNQLNNSFNSSNSELSAEYTTQDSN